MSFALWNGKNKLNFNTDEDTVAKWKVRCDFPLEKCPNLSVELIVQFQSCVLYCEREPRKLMKQCERCISIIILILLHSFVIIIQGTINAILPLLQLVVA